MAISTTTNTVLLAGNSSTVVFPYSFPFYNLTDLQVFLFDTLAGGIVQQVIGQNYSVAATQNSNGIYSNGGNIVFTSSVINTSIVVIDRQPIETQTFAILQNGFISSVGLTQQLDYLTLLIQDMADRISRSASLPTGFATTQFNPQLPLGISLASSAGLALLVNSSSTGFTLGGSSVFPSGPLGQVWTANGPGIQPSFQPVSLAGSSVTGTLSLGNGGTGGLIPSEWGVVFASSATQLATTAPGPVGFPLIANASSAPSFQALNLALAGSGAIGVAAGGTGTGQVPLNFSVPYMASPTGYGYANPGGQGQILTANASSAPTYQPINYTLGSGVLSTNNLPTIPISIGGTGQTSALAAFDALSPMVGFGAMIYNGSGNIATNLAAGSSGTVLQSFGVGQQPGWVNPTSGLQYTQNQYGVVVSGSSATQLNVIPPITSNSSCILTQVGSAGVATTASWIPATPPKVTVLSVGSGSLSGTFTPLANCLGLKVTVIGPGGGGGGCPSTASNSAAGGGGGGGGMAIKWFSGSSLLSSYNYVAWGGTNGAAAGANNSASGSSCFFGSVIATGGGGGDAGANSAASQISSGTTTGGIGFGGDLNVQGQGGGFGWNLTTASAMGGGGGSSPYGFYAQVTSGTGVGSNGTGYGGGGSGGAQANGGGTQGGGAGAPGAIIVEQYFIL